MRSVALRRAHVDGTSDCLGFFHLAIAPWEQSALGIATLSLPAGFRCGSMPPTRACPPHCSACAMMPLARSRSRCALDRLRRSDSTASVC